VVRDPENPGDASLDFQRDSGETKKERGQQRGQKTNSAADDAVIEGLQAEFLGKKRRKPTLHAKW